MRIPRLLAAFTPATLTPAALVAVLAFPVCTQSAPARGLDDNLAQQIRMIVREEIQRALHELHADAGRTDQAPRPNEPGRSDRAEVQNPNPPRSMRIVERVEREDGAEVRPDAGPRVRRFMPVVRDYEGGHPAHFDYIIEEGVVAPQARNPNIRTPQPESPQVASPRVVDPRIRWEGNTVRVESPGDQPHRVEVRVETQEGQGERHDGAAEGQHGDIRRMIRTPAGGEVHVIRGGEGQQLPRRLNSGDPRARLESLLERIEALEKAIERRLEKLEGRDEESAEDEAEGEEVESEAEHTERSGHSAPRMIRIGAATAGVGTPMITGFPLHATTVMIAPTGLMVVPGQAVPTNVTGECCEAGVIAPKATTGTIH